MEIASRKQSYRHRRHLRSSFTAITLHEIGMATAEPTSCSCRHQPCNSVGSKKAGKPVRETCVCKINGTPCSTKCQCGTGRLPCQNRPQLDDSDDEADLEYMWGEVCESNSEDNYEPDTEDIMVAFGDANPIIVPRVAKTTLNTSLQELAEDIANQSNLDCSFVEDDAGTMQISEEDPASPAAQSDEPNAEGSCPAQTKDTSTSSTEGHPPTSELGEGAAAAASHRITNKQCSQDITPSMVLAMTQEDLVEALTLLLKLYPSLVSMALHKSPPPPSPTSGPPFCNCGLCRPMPTEREQLCCRHRLAPGRCVTLTRQGILNQVVFDHQMLRQAVLDHNDINVLDKDPDAHQSIRHMAYRKYVIFRFGYLGGGERRVVPSCVVWKIRDLYPDGDEQYTGFIPSRYN